MRFLLEYSENMLLLSVTPPQPPGSVPTPRPQAYRKFELVMMRTVEMWVNLLKTVLIRSKPTKKGEELPNRKGDLAKRLFLGGIDVLPSVRGDAQDGENNTRPKRYRQASGQLLPPGRVLVDFLDQCGGSGRCAGEFEVDR